MRIIEHFDNAVRFYPDNVAFVDVGSDEPGVTYAEAERIVQTWPPDRWRYAEAFRIWKERKDLEMRALGQWLEEQRRKERR